MLEQGAHRRGADREEREGPFGGIISLVGGLGAVGAGLYLLKGSRPNRRSGPGSGHGSMEDVQPQPPTGPTPPVPPTGTTVQF
ncbi:MAG: hypothetical protein NVS4B8_09260 [Herpetosiphon sp.]